ncbi:ribosome hibernation-promoting factor, HPF/YfiA family [Paenibacillus sp. YYML68]|uniref:ribosome hibernation-promoting factor, HPF/YfiA family n=1 Tax=Paenibacillus sp. YYML68 TaxID=2909250 RepID=UPI00248F730B|nr:ribosome-associated translation inhibitor RaiA [Paenibacillus sp. YYML68]
MGLNIHGKQIEVTTALHEYTVEKLGRILERLHETADVEVMLSVQGHKHVHVVEVTIRDEGTVLRAEEKQDDMYASIDLVADKLDRKLRKLREKRRDRVRRHTEGRAAGWDTEAAFAEDEELEVIVRQKRIVLKPVDVEEAIQQLKLLDHDFHLFLNRETGQTELIYRRHNGTLGHLTTV